MAATSLCAFVGFSMACRPSVPAARIRARQSISLVPLLGLVCGLILIAPMSTTYSGFSLAQFGDALENQGQAYSDATAKITEGTQSRSGIVAVQTLLAPLTLTSLPFFAFEYFENKRYRLLFSLTLVSPVVWSVLVGRDQQMGLSILLLSGAWVLAKARRGQGLSKRQILIATPIALMGLIAFGARKLARNPEAAMCAPGADVCTIPHLYPSLWESTWVNAVSYASQGFEGLGRALGATWNFGGGFSHSPALIGLLDPLLGTSSLYRVSDQLEGLNWSAGGYWSTALTAIANDVPWPLVPAVVGCMAALLGASWRSALQHADWLSISVFGYTLVALFFIPQNLQLAVSGPTYIGYLALVVLYLARGQQPSAVISAFAPKDIAPPLVSGTKSRKSNLRATSITN